MKTAVSAGQASWHLVSDRVAAAITKTGGHLAPVRFRLPHGVVEPFSVAPWAGEKHDIPPMLQTLRGDFFCAPFGGNETAYRGESHPPHGETANAPWRFESIQQGGGSATLHLAMETRIRTGRVDKWIKLRDGETALYCRHRISGMGGRMNLGHHAMLKFPDEPGSGLLSTSRIRFGQVLPTRFENPAQGGYNSLKQGAAFSRLNRVPASDGTSADLGSFPARRGFEDLVMIVHESKPDFAWTAVTFAERRYVWFALKDPRVLRSTVLWFSNGGRHYPPWNGRHVNVMGLEDVTSYFHYGLAESARANPVSLRGFPTALNLHPDRPLTVNYIMAVAAIPRGFKRVKTITRAPGGVRLVSTGGVRVSVSLDTFFLYEQKDVAL